MSRWNFPEYPENWKDIKREILIRDRFTCVMCGAQNVPLHVDHIVPMSRGGSSESSNLQTLCEECHHKKHPWLKTSGEVPIPKARYCPTCLKAYPPEITFRTKFCPDCRMFLSRVPPQGVIDDSPFKSPPEVLAQPALVVSDWRWLVNGVQGTTATTDDTVTACVILTANVRFAGTVSLQVKRDNIGLDSDIDRRMFRLDEQGNTSFEIPFKAKRVFLSRGYYIKIEYGRNQIQMVSSYPPRLKLTK